MNRIQYFKADYFFLSNFSLTPDAPWRTSEHPYQAAKVDPTAIDAKEWQDKIINASSAGTAKRIGNDPQLPLRADWESYKFYVMKRVLAIKFDPPGSGLAQQLLDTGDAYLQEGNNWHDIFWGICDGSGSECNGHPPYGYNWLGTLLMAQRAYLRSL